MNKLREVEAANAQIFVAAGNAGESIVLLSRIIGL
jgi:hypothetical protein